MPDQSTILINRLSMLSCGLSQHRGVCRLSYKRNVGNKKTPKYKIIARMTEIMREINLNEGLFDEITFFTA